MISICAFTKDKILDVIEFEKELRKQEPNHYMLEIDERFIQDLTRSFDDSRFDHAVSLLAYKGDKVIGRIDSSLICAHFDGSINAYLEWLAVLKNERHQKVAQSLMNELRKQLKDKDAQILLAYMDANEEAQHFYQSLENSEYIGNLILIKL